jgi:hypothetical protein
MSEKTTLTHEAPNQSTITSYEGLTERKIAQIEGKKHLKEVQEFMEEQARIQKEELEQHTKSKISTTPTQTIEPQATTSKANNSLIQRIRNRLSRDSINTTPMLNLNAESKANKRGKSESRSV